MNISTKLLKAAAGQAGGAGVDVDEVFSCHLYNGTGTGSNLTVTNNIDLSTEGGLVWVKNRDATAAHALFDTVRGQNILESQSSGGQDAFSAYGGSASASYNTNGFGINGTGASNLNQSGVDYVSWTFRKAPKFFDIVTYTGDGSSNRQINHNLGCEVGMLVVKRTDGSNPWVVFHRSSDATAPEDKELQLNATDAAVNGYTTWARTAPTTTNFTVGSEGKVNENGWTYVAYLFAHHANDGSETGFGPDGDSPVISCGSFTESSSEQEINLGFEPQWLMIKTSSTTLGWRIFDMMRGFGTTSNASLEANSSSAEGGSSPYFKPTPTGFTVPSGFYGSGTNYIYMAIRRGPLAAPEDATKVFSVNKTGTGDSPTNSWPIGFNADMNIHTRTTGEDNYILARLLGTKAQRTNTTDAAGNQGSVKWFNDSSNRINLHTQWFTNNSNVISWSWKRAPSYFDVVAYTGTGSATTVTHNLGAVPEMIWVKDRGNSVDWKVYHKDLGTLAGSGEPAWKYEFALNKTDASNFSTSRWGSDPTSSVFGVGTHVQTNGSGRNYIAYLFATVAGVSKVGSYTGNGSSQTIDCGFSSGARFVLIKRTDQAADWKVYDTVRGIVAGNDPELALNSNAAEVTGYDYIDPHSSGFIIPIDNFNTNASGGSYIFYAIAQSDQDNNQTHMKGSI